MSSVPQEYLEELNSLNREVNKHQPDDLVKFCADYFNRKLKERGENATTDSPGFSGFKKLSFNTGFLKDDDHFYRDPHSPHPHAGTASDEHEDTRGNGGPQEGTQDHEDFLLNYNKIRRTSVSAESLSPDTASAGDDQNSGDNMANPVQYLSNEKKRLLDSSVAQNLVFNNMEEDSIKSVIGALQEKNVAKGTEIISQGDVGDYFYIIESGSVDFYKDGAKVNSATSGNSFGELALLHNAPRAATVVATSDCKLWALDRVSFRKIVMSNTASKRTMHSAFLREVPILKPLSDYELSKISNALGSRLFDTGDTIVKEGESGEEFFVIEYGSAEIFKNSEGRIKGLGKGDYFGEVALLHDSPRQATVTATSKTKVVTLEKKGFQRLLGEKVLSTLRQQDPTVNHN